MAATNLYQNLSARVKKVCLALGAYAAIPHQCPHSVTEFLLQNFGCTLAYYGRREKPHMNKIGAKFYTDLEEFLGLCDVVTINLPLTDKTRGMFDAKTLNMMKDGAFLVNNARGAIVDAKAVKPFPLYTLFPQDSEQPQSCNPSHTPRLTDLLQSIE